MIKLSVTNEKNLELYELEKVHVGENKFGYYLLFLPNVLNGYNLSECEVKLVQVFEDNTSVAIDVDTTQETRPIKEFITLDATAQAQTVTLSVLITHDGDVIGKTNQKTYQVYPTKNATPIDPREELDEIIAELRADNAQLETTVSEQSAEIAEKTARITDLDSQVSDLSEQVTDLSADNTRLENQHNIDIETIHSLNERGVVIPIPARLQSKEIFPDVQTKYYPPDEGYDGFSSVTAAGATVEGLGLNENYYKLGEPFLDKVGAYHPFPENSYGGIYFTELNEEDFPVGIKVVNYDYNYNDFSIPVLNMNTLRNTIKSFILLDCKNVRIQNQLFDGALSLVICRLDGVLSIGGYAFQNCTSLTDINLPDSLTSIGGYAFQNCTSLTNLTLAQGFNCNRLNVSSSIYFTTETIVACLEALADRTGETAYTITFGTTNLNKLTNEQKAIAINKNWNLA